MMKRTFFCCIQTTALTLVMAAPLATVEAQSPSPSAPPPPSSPSLQEQLEAQYPLARMTAKGGCTVINPETALALQRAGLGALPANIYSTVCATHYKDGNFSKTGFKCRYWLSMSKQNLVTLEKEDKVYPVKFEVNKDEVKVSVGYCSGDAGQAAAYKAEVVFEFPKDSLKTTGVTQVEDKIAELFSVDNQQAEGGPPPDLPQQANQSPAPEPPASVELGQTFEQVMASLGEPDTRAKGAGSKQIYVWKSRKLKVTFIDGKVADVD